MNFMHKRKLFYNTFSSLVFQVTTIICGFVLPRLIINAYGSDANGLVNSIAQFLGIIAFLELGVGAVVQSSLYKPLAENDYRQVSKIISSANKFFSKLGFILFVYVVILVVIFPHFIYSEVDWIYSATLIVAMSISTFAQYYLGVVNRLLLTADQRGYVQYIIQSITVIGNTVICCLLINLGASIQVVKLTTSLIYLLQPLFIYIYVKKNYCIDRRAEYEIEPISQKWNGVAQHVAAVILDGTDIIVLTLFDSLSNVSIYSVYHLVVKGIKQLFLSMTNGIQSLLGELWARKDYNELAITFSWTEWAIHTGTVLVFGITGLLIVPFVKVYTIGINDADYNQPFFALLLVVANAGHCLRLPYNLMILAAGHYKQTQNNYIIASVLNIVISVITVKALGLIGVAIGTLVAMFYQTVYMAWYDSKNLIKWPFTKFLKQLGADILTVGLMFILTRFFKLQQVSYWGWIILAIQVSLVAIFVVFGVNSVFYRDKLKSLINRLIIKFRV